AEIGAEVDERNAEVENRGGKPLAVPVRKRGEHEVDAFEGAVELLDGGNRISRGQVRMNGAELPPGLALPKQLRRHEFGMRGDQPQQLAADIARGSKDGCPNHAAAPIQRIAYLCKYVHIHAYD